MRIRGATFAALLCTVLSATSLAQAAPDAVVEGVQLPAWMSRDGKRQPLAIGTKLRQSDEVFTGAGSRLLLRLGDDSTVKLGENGNLKLSSVEHRRGRKVFSATLKVLEGAFRFTTAQLTKTRYTRNVAVQFPAMTVGIRGTDIWGKKFGDQEVVVLIEGEIKITRAGKPPLEMKDPLTYLQAPPTGDAIVNAVPMEQLKVWAAETEISEESGALRQGGKWKLYLGRYDRQADALAVYDSLRRDGFPVRIHPRQLAEAIRYEVRLSGLSTESQANVLGARMKETYPLLDPVSSMD